MLLNATRSIRRSVRRLRAFVDRSKRPLHSSIGAPGALASLRDYAAWRASLIGASPLDDERPWITFAAARFLTRVIRPGDRIFEWGCGGSTLFFQNLGAVTTSIEHDPVWHARVVHKLEARGGRFELSLAPADEAAPRRSLDPADPGQFGSSDPQFAGRTFERYVRIIERHTDATFDVILIDGRARPACIRHSISRLKPGGWLVLDNADRAHYQPAIRMLLAGFERRDFAGPIPYVEHFVCTSAWRRRATR